MTWGQSAALRSFRAFVCSLLTGITNVENRAFCFQCTDFPESVPEKTTPQRPSHHSQLCVLGLLDHVFALIFDSEGKVRLTTHRERQTVTGNITEPEGY